jgi:mono/diheme cytochrome c family protein
MGGSVMRSGTVMRLGLGGFVVLLNQIAAGPATAADSANLADVFAKTIKPFFAEHCVGCHNPDKRKGDLNLAAFTSFAAVEADQRPWVTVLEALTTRQMPPESAAKQPSDSARAAVVAWIETLRRFEANKNAGDPGPVLTRRLSNAEYDRTIADLTGADIRPTREFPVDPANEAGFDNSGESLAMSPALFKKYLGAARAVAEHLVFTPDELRFAPHPVVTDTDRDRYAVLRIIDFYQRQPTDLARYFEAAWRYQHRAALGQPKTDLATIARTTGVSPRYLPKVFAALTKRDAIGPLAKLQSMWRALPTPGAPEAEAKLRTQSAAMRDFVVRVREAVTPFWANLQSKFVGTGSQPFILWKNRQYATHRRSFDAKKLYPEGPGIKDEVTRRAENVATYIHGSLNILAALGLAPTTTAVPFAFYRNFVATVAPPDPDLAIPPGPAARKRYEAAWSHFADVFPDAFFVSERGRVHLDRPKERQDKGRFLSAGFHNMMGYFRDDLPLSELILDAAGRRELDRLWQELDYVTDAPKRQHADFIFYERAEPPRSIKGPDFDFVRSEDKSSTSAAMIRRLAQVYIAKAKQSWQEFGGDKIAVPVLEDYFRNVAGNVARVERQRLAAEPRHLANLVAFAERAYRRPLGRGEAEDLHRFYQRLRSTDGLGHEDAVRDTLASILTSPHFLYRVDLVAAAGRAPQRKTAPLPDHALASRLSYFLWASMPDDKLRQLATAGRLHEKKVLVAQTRRLLRDGRARALAVEFGGQWLDFRRFEEHAAVDRTRFPNFDNDLRRAMYEEPIHFFDDLVRNDGSLLDFIEGRHTFVNAPLAKHYGMPAVAGDGWHRIADAGRYGRGGLLPMAVFLTQNSPGLRTSPVKRGYWVVRRILGERIPPPPAEVPDLPNDEKQLGNLTLREVLEKHRADKACAGCHARFDAFGLAFEGYGPIGERRTLDLGGKPVDTRATFPGAKAEAVGFEGLRAYVSAERRKAFVDNFCRKLFAYALGRGLQLSDEATIEKLTDDLAANGYKLGTLIEGIVQSPQFLTRRTGDELAQGQRDD